MKNNYNKNAYRIIFAINNNCDKEHRKYENEYE